MLPLSHVFQVKSEGPKLVPFFKATCVYFVLWLPSSSPSWVSALIKCLPIFCLWLFLLAHGLGFLLTHPSATRIFVGLVFSAIGDAFLIWQDQGYFGIGTRSWRKRFWNCRLNRLRVTSGPKREVGLGL